MPLRLLPPARHPRRASSAAGPALLLTALALAAGQALAQGAPTASAPESAEGGAMQTITVTARRVDERIIDVPLSIRALSGRDLADRGIASLTDLASFTPGISYSPDLGRVSERPVVRGISALRPEAPQPVSVFIDGIFLREGALSLLLDDAQRVEVIKGPQSALYGRSTYAGAINYITVKPGNEMKGVVNISLGQAEDYSAFGAVTVPLKKDVASMRIKARTSGFGGQYTNSQTGAKIGHESNDAIGAVFSLTPSKTLDMMLSLDRSTVRDGLFNATARPVPTQNPPGTVTSQNGSTNVPNGAQCNGRTIAIVGNNAAGLPDANVPPTAANRANGWPCGAANFSGTTVTRNELDLGNYTDPATGIAYGNIAGLDRTINRLGFTLNWEIGGYMLTAQTGWTKQFTGLGADQSYNNTRFSIAGASWLSYNRDNLRYWSQEVRLSSPDDGPLTWLVGAFLYDEEGKGQTANGVIGRGANNTIVARSMSAVPGSATTNSAPFARVQYELGKALRFSLEGRYNKETVEVVGTPLGVATVTAGTCTAGQQCIVSGKRTFTDFSPRFTVDFKPGKESLIYGQLARGSKSGGFNTSAGIPSNQFAYEGETITSVELGYKAALGGSVGFSAAVFRNDVEDLQLSNIITIVNPFSANPAAPSSSTVTIVNNVGKARTQGVEFDLSWRATDWLTLTANYAFTDAKALEGTEVTNGTVYGGNMSVAGFTLPRTPKHAGAFSAALDMPFMGNVRLTGRMDVTYQSRRYAEIQNTIWADPYKRVNLSAGLRGKGWTARLWVKNATNDDTSLNGFRYLDPVTFRRTAVDFLPRLRQVGVTGTYEF
jgi:outer membrane receptor protein involved in Fe transport